MNNKLLKTAVLVSALVSNQAVFAKDQSPSDWWCGVQFSRIATQLKLDDAQQTKIKAIKEQLQAGLKSKRDQMDNLRKEINQQVQSASMDQTKLDGLIDTKAQLIGTMMKAENSAMHQIYGVLNEQQKTQYMQMQQQWEDTATQKYRSCHD